MISRAWMLLAAALASPAWSQGTAAVPPTVTPKSFDLRSATIQQLVRDTAATQCAPVLQKPAPPASMTFASPEDSAAMDDPPALREPVPAAAPAPPPAPRWFRILFGAVEEILEPEEDPELKARYLAWNLCLANNRDKPTELRNRACPQVPEVPRAEASRIIRSETQTR